MTSLTLNAAAAVALAFAMSSVPVSESYAEDKPGMASPAASFSEQRLNNFAAAAKEVFEIRQKYAPQFEAASTDADKKLIVQTARGEMEQAIKGKGLTLEQYNEVLVAAKDDQALAEKLGKMMDAGNAKKGG